MVSIHIHPHIPFQSFESISILATTTNRIRHASKTRCAEIVGSDLSTRFIRSLVAHHQQIMIIRLTTASKPTALGSAHPPCPSLRTLGPSSSVSIYPISRSASHCSTCSIGLLLLLLLFWGGGEGKWRVEPPVLHRGGGFVLSIKGMFVFILAGVFLFLFSFGWSPLRQTDEVIMIMTRYDTRTHRESVCVCGYVRETEVCRFRKRWKERVDWPGGLVGFHSVGSLNPLPPPPPPVIHSLI